jgi:cell division protein FtsL
MELKKKRQILITFIISIVFSSLMVFFAVYTRTAQLLEQEKLEQQSKSADSEAKHIKPEQKPTPSEAE